VSTSAREGAVLCQAASVLLQYPDEYVRERFPVVVAALGELPPSDARDRLLEVVRELAARPELELAEHYVQVFDRRRRCSPYLTWWSDGETRRRGGSLAALKERYRMAGLELGEGELPDYLPVVLEYAALDLADGLAVLQEHRAGLELLRLALQDARTPYAGVLTAVCALLPGASPQDRAAAQRLARSGPPEESVGLEPFGAHTGHDDGLVGPPAPGHRRELGLEATGGRR
jgi:nitrate reductase delta subunit